jgi:hypothetical protein
MNEITEAMVQAVVDEMMMQQGNGLDIRENAARLVSVVAANVKPWAIIERGKDDKIAAFSPKFNVIKARFTAGGAIGMKVGDVLFLSRHPERNDNAE